MMVKTIDRYFGRSLFLLCLYALLALVGLDFLIDFASEQAEKSAHIPLLTVFLDTVWGLPEKVSVYFPFAILVGSVLAVGHLTSQLELEAALLLGYSYSRMIIFFLLFALLSSVLMMAVNELAVASSERQEYPEDDEQGSSDRWFRERNRMIHVGQIVREAGETGYRDVRIFEMSTKGTLVTLIDAKSMVVDEQAYHFKGVRVTHFKKPRPDFFQVEEYTVPRMLPAAGKSLEAPRPEQLDIVSLARYVSFLKMSTMRSDLFELAFWERFANPLSIPIMLLLALPFLFFNLHKRYSSGAQLLMAIILGASYWIASQAVANAAIIWGLPAALAAFGTHLLCCAGFALYFPFYFFRARDRGMASDLVT